MTVRRTRLATLIHISDLHFGVPAAEEGVDPPRAWRHWGVLDGFLGHHRDALIQLTTFVDLLRRMETDPSPVLVVTGDLTACGKADEFKRARRFLETSYAQDHHIVGLLTPDAMKRCIPGNHDHWPGSWRIVGEPAALAQHFPTLPIPEWRVPLGDGRELAIFGLNSDADVDPVGSTRLLAQGSFVSQVEMLAKQVGPPQTHEIRALLVHHSPEYERAHAASRTARLVVRQASQNVLDEWLKRAGISVLLTGHIHVPLGEIVSVEHRGVRWEILEARCGTTTQLDEIPLKWVEAGVNPPDRLPKNTLIVHRLFAEGGTIVWECELFARLHFGFTSTGPLPGMEKRGIVVWPRET